MRGARRLIFWLLVLELIAAFAVATAIRIEIEEPARYIGSATPPCPDRIAEPGTSVLEAGQHEEQIA